MARRGFAIEATTPAEIAIHVAEASEAAGYTSLWSNDLPHADGLDLAIAMAAATTAIDVGVGVIALDRRAPDSLDGSLGPNESNRIVLGVGAGFSQSPLDDVRSGVERIRRLRPDLRVAVAAMGPKMCELAGEIADVVLLNWMTPERIEWARPRIAAGATGRSTPPRVAAYVRVATGPDAADLLRQAESHYRRLPHYARHFEAMGATPGTIGVSSAHPQTIDYYEALLDDVIVRPVGNNIDEILESMAPG